MHKLLFPPPLGFDLTKLWPSTCIILEKVEEEAEGTLLIEKKAIEDQKRPQEGVRPQPRESKRSKQVDISSRKA